MPNLIANRLFPGQKIIRNKWKLPIFHRDFGNCTIYCGPDHMGGFSYMVSLMWRRSLSPRPGEMTTFQRSLSFKFGEWRARQEGGLLRWRRIDFDQLGGPREFSAARWTGRRYELVGINWPMRVHFFRGRARGHKLLAFSEGAGALPSAVGMPLGGTAAQRAAVMEAALTQAAQGFGAFHDAIDEILKAGEMTASDFDHVASWASGGPYHWQNRGGGKAGEDLRSFIRSLCDRYGVSSDDRLRLGSLLQTYSDALAKAHEAA